MPAPTHPPGTTRRALSHRPGWAGRLNPPDAAPPAGAPADGTPHGHDPLPARSTLSPPPLPSPLRALIDRRRWRRYRRATLAVALAGLVIALGAGIVVRAETARLEWSETRQVLVARTDIPPGTRLGPEHLTTVELPEVAIPPGALPPAQAPAPGATSGGLITAGEVILPHRLAPSGTSAAAARVGAGRRAVAIPVAVDPGVISAGDAVDLVVVANPLAGGGAGVPPPQQASRGAPRAPGVVAGDATVLDVAPGVITVVVAADDAPRVVAAMATGTVVPVLVGR